jgi:hypothetical protein
VAVAITPCVGISVTLTIMIPLGPFPILIKVEFGSIPENVVSTHVTWCLREISGHI